MESYWRRLRSRAWLETKKFWSAYRWWTSASGPIVAIALLLARNGWTTIMNGGGVLINAIGGAVVSFIGVWVISLIRSTRLLDDDRQVEIVSAKNEVAKLRDVLAASKGKAEKPPRTAAQKQYYQQAKSALAELGSGAEGILRHLMLHGEITLALVTNVSGTRIQARGPLPKGTDANGAHTLLNQCMLKNLVTLRTTSQRDGPNHVSEETYLIAPAMMAALEELLYPDSAAS